MKRILVYIVICCLSCMIYSCESMSTDAGDNTGNNQNITNPVAGTSWVWSDSSYNAIITWTFTFTETEVIFDYRGEWSADDITTERYTSTYTYTSDTVYFDMEGWSGIVWKYTGKISGDSMHLVDSGIEQIDITLNKVH